MKITLDTLPLSTNQLYANGGYGRRILSPKGRVNKEAMAWEAMAQRRGEPLTGPIAVHVFLWWPDRRGRDVDNIKALLDAMNGVLWVDDKQIVFLLVEKGVDAARPRCELDVSRTLEKLP